MKLAKIAKFDSLIELLDAFPDEESCIIKITKNKRIDPLVFSF